VTLLLLLCLFAPQDEARDTREALKQILERLDRLEKRLDTLEKAMKSASKPDQLGAANLAKVDLLKLINPLKPRHMVKGEWRFDDKALVSPLDEFARVQVPYAPPEEYDLRVVAERLQGDDTFVIGLPLPVGRTFINLDAGPSVGYYSGLQGIDAVPLIARDEGKVSGQVLKDGKPNTIVCKVRKQSLTLMVNGRFLVEYSGDYRRLECGPDWDSPQAKAVILGSWQTSYRLTEVELTPVSGAGKVIE
jgi:hypothetical protein